MIFLGWEGWVTNKWTRHRLVVKETGNRNETVASLRSISVISTLRMIVRVNIVLNRTVVVDSD